MGFYASFIKRPADFILALMGLVVLSPLLLVISIWLSIVNKGSPLFFQDRPGKGEKVFRLIKFKTMGDHYDPNGLLLPDHERITGAGRFVRSASLDELPQLFNVLKGDMSLVGPRPLLISYLPLYSEFQACRHEVKPGITGWTQVNGRNSIDWDTKLKLDVWYVNNVSFLLDVKILWLTLLKVVKREGINAGENIIMAPFTGNKT